MPSRFVTDASRHVTPGHGDASRSERDIGVTEAGQDADKTGTGGAVPRDNLGTSAGQVRDTRGTDGAVTGDKRTSNALVTRDASGTAVALPLPPPTPRTPEERREDELRFFGYPTAREQARLDGRHGRTWWDVIAYGSMRHRTDREVAAIRAAFDEGVDLRHRNVRCFCNTCLMPPEIVEREHRRWAYMRRRHDELAAQGRSPADAEKLILEEVARGMAL